MTRIYGWTIGENCAVDNTLINTINLSSIHLDGRTTYTTYSRWTIGEKFVEYLMKVILLLWIICALIYCPRFITFTFLAFFTILIFIILFFFICG